MAKSASRLNWLMHACLSFTLLALTTCGTLEVALEEPVVTSESPVSTTIPAERPTSTLAATATPSEGVEETEVIQALAWYGTIHSVAGGEPVTNYLKPWHLNIWPKFGPAVGITGADTAINYEIDRLRDTDTKATFWGQLTCGVSTYGPCQLLVTRLSANDGGPSYAPDKIEDWEGSVGRLPAQPGSQNERLFFVLAGEIPVLYGIASEDPAIQEELERLTETGTIVRIWGKLHNKAQPVTGAMIDVERLEIASP